jgi:hypothetical protein
MLHEKASLTVLKEEFDAFVLILRLAKPAELEYSPRLAAVTVLIGAAEKRRLAGTIGHGLRVANRNIVRTVVGLELDTRCTGP